MYRQFSKNHNLSIVFFRSFVISLGLRECFRHQKLSLSNIRSFRCTAAAAAVCVSKLRRRNRLDRRPNMKSFPSFIQSSVVVVVGSTETLESRPSGVNFEHIDTSFNLVVLPKLIRTPSDVHATLDSRERFSRFVAHTYTTNDNQFK